CERLAAFPRPPRRGLAAGVSQLDAELGGAVATAVGNKTRERRFAIVGIEAETAVTDAATALDAGGLDDDHSGTAIGQHAGMAGVPVGRHAVISAVLAHGRDDDPVRELEIGEPDRREQSAGHVIGAEFGESMSGPAP